MRKALVAVVILLLVGLGVWFALWQTQETPPPLPAPVLEVKNPKYEVIGQSVEGRSIEAYAYWPERVREANNKHLLFVGGVHGGYEWNSVLLAYKFIDYLNDNLGVAPKNVSVTVIPALNPDGVQAVTGKSGRFRVEDVAADEGVLAAGRFNAHEVDLNRNFDCKWQPTSRWQGREVSAGASAFSEPEAQALQNFVLKHRPDAVVFWHSKANAVYASECEEGILPETLEIMDIYAKASNYGAVASFDSYPITGDAEGWLASIGIPAITVELKTHETVEWEQNLAGIRALFNYYTKPHPLTK